MPDFSNSRRALFLTFSVPGDIEAASNGFHRRQSLLIDAIKATCSDIEVLLFTDPNIQVNGDSLRKNIESNLENLWGGNFQVTLCPREVSNSNSTSWWQRYILPAINFYRQPSYVNVSGKRQVAAFESCLSRNPDFIFVHRLMSIPPVLLSRLELPPVFLDLDDIEHIAFLRSIVQPPHWASKRFEYFMLPALINGERRAIRRCTNTFVCSVSDQLKLRQLFLTKKVLSIPNAVATRVQKEPLTQRKSLLLLGDYRYGPNRVGAEFFIENIWPIIIAVIPEAQMIVAGHRSDLIRRTAEAVKGIDFPGFLPDLDAAYAEARIVVCPILSGGGTRVKIIEAAAYGKPIVATKIGAEGIDLIDGSEIFLRDRPHDFADACIDLLKDYAKASEAGCLAARAIEVHYDRVAVVSKLSQALICGLTSDGTGRSV